MFLHHQSTEALHGIKTSIKPWQHPYLSCLFINNVRSTHLSSGLTYQSPSHLHPGGGSKLSRGKLHCKYQNKTTLKPLNTFIHIQVHVHVYYRYWSITQIRYIYTTIQWLWVDYLSLTVWPLRTTEGALLCPAYHRYIALVLILENKVQCICH